MSLRCTIDRVQRRHNCKDDEMMGTWRRVGMVGCSPRGRPRPETKILQDKRREKNNVVDELQLGNEGFVPCN